MEHSEGNGRNAEATQCVRVAVNIRPLITNELLQGCTDCITVVPGEPQVRSCFDLIFSYWIFFCYNYLFNLYDAGFNF